MSTKTSKLNLHKIDLTDAPPDITVLNQNWDVLDEKVGNLVTTHNQKIYTDLSQIGLTVGSETIVDIATKLPTYSKLVITVAGTNNMSIYPNSNFGLLEVEKTVNSRIMFTFTSNSGVQWIAAYAIGSSGDTWSDWAMNYNSNYLTYGTVDLVAGSTALTTGRVHLVYE